MKKFFTKLLASLTLLSAATSYAAAEDYGTLIAGSYQPSGSFASLSVVGGSNTYTFTLSALDFNSIFTNGAFIGSIAVDVDQPFKLVGPKKEKDSIALSAISGPATIDVKNGKGPGGEWDFQFDLGNSGPARFTANESLSWTATFSKPVDFADAGFALHVQGLTDAQGGSAWYIGGVPVTAVPELETYAMMLAGLSLMGFMAKRRRS